MSGRDLVRGLRSEAAPPPKQPQRGGGVVDFLIGAVAIVAVASFGYFGYATWLAPKPAHVAVAASAPTPPVAPKAQPAVSVADVDTNWTNADSQRCKAAARAAAEAPLPVDAVLTQRSVTEGFASMATLVECQISSKTARFCAPEEKTKLVAAVQNYLDKMDLIVLGLGVQGAPMAIMGEAFGGEVAFGSKVYEMQEEGTLAVMRVHHKKVVDAVKALARDGVIAQADFAAFLGMGVPTAIKTMLKGVEAERNICTRPA